MAHRQELESLGCGVVVVGQNEDIEQAEEWNVSGSFYCDFIHLCDPGKTFYKACAYTCKPRPKLDFQGWFGVTDCLCFQTDLIGHSQVCGVLCLWTFTLQSR